MIKEASGLETFDNQIFWTHNDDRYSILYGIDSTGTLQRAVHLRNKNSGWEDLTTDRQGNMYIGAFGNNRNDKRDTKILKIPDPSTITDAITLAPTIKYIYEDQLDYPPRPENLNFDVDAFVCLGDSLYLFTKNRTKPYNGIINVYVLPTLPGEYTAVKTDSFRLPGKEMFSNWITGVDISPDGSMLCLLFHDKVLIIKNFKRPHFSSGDFIQLNLGHFSHKAGNCFIDNQNLLIVDENELDLIGGNIYRLHLDLK